MDTPTPAIYEVPPNERAVLLNLQQAAMQRKVEVYELNMQLELAHGARDKAQDLFIGAVTMLANSHGMPIAEINPELTVITGK